MSILLRISGSDSVIYESIPGTFDPVRQVWGQDILSGDIAMSGKTSTYPTLSQTSNGDPRGPDEDKDDEQSDPDPE